MYNVCHIYLLDYTGPITSSIASDVVKYGVDALNDIRQGREPRDFDLGGTISNALFGLAWGKLPGKYVDRFRDYIAGSGGELY